MFLVKLNSYMNIVYIEHFTEAHVRIRTDPGILSELAESFTYYKQGYKFTPKYKAGIWDGKIRLLNRRNSTLPKGLVPELVKRCYDSGYKVKFEDGYIAPFKEEIPLPLDKWNLKFEPRDFQLDAVRSSLKNKRQIVLSPTASGKSFIVYLLVRALQEITDDHILILVPRVGLTTQIYSDFEDYSENDTWSVEENVATISSGRDKTPDQQVYISTWQSLQHMRPEYFERFIGIIGDEVHEYEAEVGSKILEKSIHAFYRIGLTGTLKDAKTHELSLTGSFGPAYRVADTKELMDRGLLASLSITGLVLTYQNPGINGNTKYQEEIDYIVRHERRLDFTAKLAGACKGNTLVLFNFVEKHGKPLYKRIQELFPDKQVHFVFGGTDVDQREQIRKIAEAHHDVIIIASYGTFSTGVNIVNLSNLILASPTKAKIRLLQSIGRVLRKSDQKLSCKMFDIADDLRGKRKKDNFALTHFKSRYDIYCREGFNVKLKAVSI